MIWWLGWFHLPLFSICCSLWFESQSRKSAASVHNSCPTHVILYLQACQDPLNQKRRRISVLRGLVCRSMQTTKMLASVHCQTQELCLVDLSCPVQWEMQASARTCCWTGGHRVFRKKAAIRRSHLFRDMLFPFMPVAWPRG